MTPLGLEDGDLPELEGGEPGSSKADELKSKL